MWVSRIEKKETGQDHCEDGREPGTETRPVEINEQEPVVGLVKGNLAGRVGDFGVDGDHCLVLSMDGRGLGSTGGMSMLSDVLLDELLFTYLVNDILSVAEEERGHVDG